MNDHEAKSGPERYWCKVERLTGIFRGISEKVNEVSDWHCPYKNTHDRCTARFDYCNQNRAVVPGDLYRCKGSDSLDYLLARETGGP